jgi:ribosomal protein S18 acetylase RimI-like enzyme
METTKLRDFTEADFDSLGRLWAATGVGNPARGDTLDSIRRTLASGGRLLVLDDGGEVVGSCWLTDDARRLYVHHMAVAPALQGQGLGARLLEKAIDIAADKGLQMKLEVHHDNARAIALYKRLGFDFIGDYEVMLRRAVGRA